MRLFPTLIIVLLIVGCSKHPVVKSHTAPPANLKELGAVELVPGKPTQFNLGTNQCCILIGKQLSGSIDIRVVVLTTNADGNVDRHSFGEISVGPGRQCAIGNGTMEIGFTPTLKAP